MSIWPFFRTVRARLTLWYTSALAAVLIFYAVGVYLFLRHNFYAELDRQLYDDFEVAEGALKRDASGRIRRRTYHHTHKNHKGHKKQHLRTVEVWSRDGRLLFREGDKATRLPQPELARGGAYKVETIHLPSGVQMRIRSALYRIGSENVLIRVARSEARLRHELMEFLVGMAIGLPLALVLACIGGYLLAVRTLAPVGLMATRARMISADRLDERLPVENPHDELGQLGTIFNETLARLEHSFETLRHFTADAAHELRTPLTALKSVGEVGLRNSKSETECREVIGSMLEEADRLTRLVDALLLLTRADSRKVEIHPEQINLKSFSSEIVTLLEVLAEERGQSVFVEGEADVFAFADPLVLRQACINVLDNAIKYSPNNSHIRIVVSQHENEAILAVFDQGPGISAEHSKRIFERFYRVDKARTRGTGNEGLGLGLAIAWWAVRANGGYIELESEVGKGSCFRIRLQLATQNSIAPTKGELTT